MSSNHRKKNIIELTHCSDEQYRKMPKLPLAVMADNIRSMHNIGAIFRTADAFLFKEFILGGISGTPPHHEISKSALGAENAVSWRYVTNPYEEILSLKEEGWTVCVLEQTHNSVPLHCFIPDKNKKYIIVAGNEVSGVDQKIADEADFVLEIPQFGTKHSLNVSVSAGIAMHHFFSHFMPL